MYKTNRKTICLTVVHLCACFSFSFLLCFWLTCIFLFPCFNPLTPTAFCQKCIFWTFWRFSAWIWTELGPIYSTWQHESTTFFRPALLFTTFLPEYAWKSKFEVVLGFLCFCLFLLPLLFLFFLSFFVAVIDLLLGLLPLEKPLSKLHYAIE